MPRWCQKNHIFKGTIEENIRYGAFTASLDAIATEQIKNPLDAIKQGCTVVIISHSLVQIVDSDCIYVMKKATWWKAAPTTSSTI